MPHRRKREGPFAAFYKDYAHAQAHPNAEPAFKRGKLLEVVKLSLPSHEASTETSTAPQPGPGTTTTGTQQFLERYVKLLSEEHVQAALGAAASLNKQAFSLPPLHVDRSHWKPEMAAHLPLRKPPSEEPEHEEDTWQDPAGLLSPNFMAPLKGAGRAKRAAAEKAERLNQLMGPVLDKYLSGVAAREAEEAAKEALLLQLAVEEELKVQQLAQGGLDGALGPGSIPDLALQVQASQNGGVGGLNITTKASLRFLKGLPVSSKLASPRAQTSSANASFKSARSRTVSRQASSVGLLSPTRPASSRKASFSSLAPGSLSPKAANAPPYVSLSHRVSLNLNASNLTRNHLSRLASGTSQVSRFSDSGRVSDNGLNHLLPDGVPLDRPLDRDDLAVVSETEATMMLARPKANSMSQMPNAPSPFLQGPALLIDRSRRSSYMGAAPSRSRRSSHLGQPSRAFTGMGSFKHLGLSRSQREGFGRFSDAGSISEVSEGEDPWLAGRVELHAVQAGAVPAPSRASSIMGATAHRKSFAGTVATESSRRFSVSGAMLTVTATLGVQARAGRTHTAAAALALFNAGADSPAGPPPKHAGSRLGNVSNASSFHDTARDSDNDSTADPDADSEDTESSSSSESSAGVADDGEGEGGVEDALSPRLAAAMAASRRGEPGSQPKAKRVQSALRARFSDGTELHPEPPHAGVGDDGCGDDTAAQPAMARGSPSSTHREKQLHVCIDEPAGQERPIPNPFLSRVKAQGPAGMRQRAHSMSGGAADFAAASRMRKGPNNPGLRPTSAMVTHGPNRQSATLMTRPSSTHRQSATLLSRPSSVQRSSSTLLSRPSSVQRSSATLLPRPSVKRSDTKEDTRPMSQQQRRSHSPSHIPPLLMSQPSFNAAHSDPWAAAKGRIALDDEDERTRVARLKRMSMVASRASTTGNAKDMKKNTKATMMAGLASVRMLGKNGSSSGGAHRSRAVSRQGNRTSNGSLTMRHSYINDRAAQVATEGAGVYGKLLPNHWESAPDAGAPPDPAATHPEPPPQPVGHEPSRMGVSLLFIQTLSGLVTTDLGKEAAQKLPTAEVVRRYIMPRTKVPGVRLLDLLPDGVVSQPRYLVSHMWGGSFTGLVSTLTRYFQDLGTQDPERIYLWLDFMAVDQHARVEVSALLETVKDVSSAVQQTLVCIDEDGLALNRTWMLYEIWSAIHHQPTSNRLVVLLMDTRATPLVSELFKQLDICRSEALEETDKEAILEAISHTTASETAQRDPSHGSILTKLSAHSLHSRPPSTEASVVIPAVHFTSPFTLGGRAQGNATGKGRRKGRMALLQADLGGVNRAIKNALISSCAREAQKAVRMLATSHGSPRAYIRLATQAAIMLHLEGKPGQAEQLLRRVLAYQLLGSHAGSAELRYVVLALIDALIAQNRLRDSLMVATKAYEAAERCLGRGHRVTACLGLGVWEGLTASGQHHPAEALARTLYTRLERIHSNRQLLPSTHDGLYDELDFALMDPSTPISPGVPLHLHILLDQESQALSQAGLPAAGLPAADEQPGFDASLVLGQGVEMEMAMAQLALGQSLLSIGKLVEASSLLQAALDTHQGLMGGKHHPRCITPLLALGHWASNSSLYGDAVSWYTQARSLMVRWYPKESRVWVDACCDQSSALQALGDLKTAEKLMRRLLAPPLRLKFQSSRSSAVGPQASLADTISRGLSVMSVRTQPANSVAAVLASQQLSEEEQHAAEDARLGGRWFEVVARLVEVLTARSVTVPLVEAPDLKPKLSEGVASNDGDTDTGLLGKLEWNTGLMAGLLDGGKAAEGLAVLDTPRTAAAREAIRQAKVELPVTEALKIVNELCGLAEKLLKRYSVLGSSLRGEGSTVAGAAATTDSNGPKSVSPAPQAGPAATVAASGFGRVRRHSHPAAGAAASHGPGQGPKSRKPMLPPLQVPGAAAAAEPTKGTSSSKAVAAGSAPTRKTQNSSTDSNKAGPSVSAPILSRHEREAQFASWLKLLTHIVDSMNSNAAVLLNARELEAAYRMYSTALDLHVQLFGPTSQEAFLTSMSGTLDALLQLRRFLQAREVSNTYRNHQSMSAGAKEILRMHLEPMLSGHAFQGASENDFELVTCALEMGAATMRGEERLLVLAASLGHFETSVAITRVVPTSIHEEEGRCGLRALAVAASLGFLEIVEHLLHMRGLVVDAADWEGRTALFHAAKTGQYRCAVLLLERGHANPNYLDLNRCTPLMAAAAAGHLAVMQILMEKKASVDQVDTDLRTAVMYAASRSQAASLDLLLRCHARANVKDCDGCTALMMACTAGCLDSVYVLLSYKCEVNPTDSLEQTAMFKAAAKGHCDIMELLFLEDSDTSLKDCHGRTLLHSAAQGGHVEACALLINLIARGKEMKRGQRVSVMGGGAAPSRLGVDQGVGVPQHTRMRVDQVLAARGAEMCQSVGGTHLAEMEPGMKDILAGALKNSYLAPSAHTSYAGTRSATIGGVPLPALDLPGSIMSRSGTAARRSAVGSEGGLSRTKRNSGSTGGSLSGSAKEPVDPMQQLRLLLQYANLGGVRAFVGCTDKYAQTAADLALEGGHTELARILRLFGKKDVNESTSEAQTPVPTSRKPKAGSISVSPRTQSMNGDGNTSAEPSPRSRLFKKDPPKNKAVANLQAGSRRVPRRESISGMEVRLAALRMDAEYDD